MAAGDPELGNPAPLVTAFHDTCLADFPNTDTIARKAVASGWIERTVRFAGAPNGLAPTDLPRFLSWRGLSMSLTKPQVVIKTTGCQVSAPPSKSLDIVQIAAATSAQLGLGTPVMIHRKGDEIAQWRTGPDRLLEAGLLRYNRTRTLSLNIRLEPEQPHP